MSGRRLGVLSANRPNERAEPYSKVSFRLESPRTKGPSRMSTNNEVTLAIDDRVAVVEMHRPPANFLNRDLLAGIADAGEEAQSAGARAIVLCSEGRHFCAGLNLSDRFGQLDPREAAAAVYHQGMRIFALELPVIAAVQGTALGGGLGLACAADFRVASPETRFEANFSRLGFHHGFALSVTLPRIVGNQHAAFMLYSSAEVLGEQAHRIGLADRIVAQVDLRDQAIDLARQIAAAAPLAVKSMRCTLRQDLIEQLDKALEHELDEQARLWQTEDCAIGIQSARERQVPAFVGR
jgi:enoyl-CoA hydratase/carnithine racemase